jgi:hypothetical protein
MADGDWTLALTGERTARHRCGICGNLYAYNPRYRVSCCVAHPPGTCCHYGETLVAEEPVESWYPQAWASG